MDFTETDPTLLPHMKQCWYNRTWRWFQNSKYDAIITMLKILNGMDSFELLGYLKYFVIIMRGLTNE